jgi:CubicO group peptidase (beta-lactamase class C family)
MLRVFMILAGVLGVVVLVGSSWFFRPWSPYSPAEIMERTKMEHRVYTFRNMDEIFPYREVSASESAISLPRALDNLDVSFAWQGDERNIDQWMGDSDTTGLMVLHNGVVVHEQYRLDADQETRHTSWSVGKSFVATLIAMAMHDGHIESLDQTAETFAPQFAGTDYGRTSLRHLLMMSAGVDFNEDYGAPDSDIRNLFIGAAVMGSNIDNLVGEVERDREPGQDLHYVSANTQVLSAVVRAIYDAPLAQVIEDRIWSPLGMAGGATWNQNIQGDDGIAIGYCCLNARLEEYARFGQFYLQDGVWEGERLLPEGWVEQATRPNAPFQEPSEDSIYAPRGYGLHFWVPNDPQGEYFMAGVFGQYIWVDERRNIVIARTAADETWGPRTRESLAAMRAIARVYGDVDDMAEATIELETENE